MKKRFLVRSSGCAALLALGCGADSVNVGDRPEPVGGGDSTGSADAGGSLVEGSTGCNIPNLGQYRLLFDSDGSRVQWTGHTAFDDPTAAPDAPARESIEIRTISFIPAA